MSKDKQKESNLSQLPVKPNETPALPEKISDEDRAVLNDLKSKREMALLNAKLALSQSETLEAQNANLILQLAMKYRLNDGDKVSDEGVISRIENKGDNK